MKLDGQYHLGLVEGFLLAMEEGACPPAIWESLDFLKETILKHSVPLEPLRAEIKKIAEAEAPIVPPAPMPKRFELPEPPEDSENIGRQGKLFPHIDNIRAMKAAGASDEEIGKKYNCSGPNVCNFRKKYHIEKAKRVDTPPETIIAKHGGGYAGKRAPQPNPINEYDWLDIKARLDKGHKRKEIASDYEVSPDHLDDFIAQHDYSPPPGKQAMR